MANTFASPATHAATAARAIDFPWFFRARFRETLLIWEERKHFRLKLEEMLKTAPHLIEDIGLTRKQAEAEIAKPCWRA